MGSGLSLKKRFQRKGGRTVPHRQVGRVTCGFFLNCVELRVIEEPRRAQGLCLAPEAVLPHKWGLWYIIELKKSITLPSFFSLLESLRWGRGAERERQVRKRQRIFKVTSHE